MFTQRLDELDRSSAGFPERLNNLLRDGQWVTSLILLPEGELCELINYLNDVMSISNLFESHLLLLDA